MKVQLVFMSFIVLMVPYLWAAQNPGAATQAPTFKSKVEIVQLDVSVLDKHRQPVRGLTQNDFTILEDGKPQPIVGFDTFDVDSAEAPATGWMRDVAPDVATNQRKETRLFVIVMDDAMIPQDPFSIQSSKKIATSIIEKLGPDDLTAVVFTGDNRKTQDFTSDKAKLRAALDTFNPGLAGYRFGFDSQGVDVDTHFYISTIRTLSSVADYLIAVPNRRKALFWVSSGVPFDTDDMKVRPAPYVKYNSTEPAMAQAIDMRDLADRTQEIFRRAQLANVTIYPIDPSGLGGFRAVLEGRITLKDLPEPERTTFLMRKTTAAQDFLAQAAASTGGRTVMNTNEFDTGIREVFDENESYYLIGFEPTNGASDGTLRRIQVKVNRPDVDVRTRSSYYAPEAPKADKKPDKKALTPEAAALQKAMGSILPMAGMPMRASVAPFAVPGQRLATVAIVLGITQPIPASAAGGRITETTDILTSAFTPEGDARGAQRHTAKVTIRAGANGDASYEALSRIDLPPGRYQLRLAAHNGTSGRDGSVFADVTVPDYSNIPFSASPIVLGATPGRVSAPRDLLTPLLPFVPTAEREFARADKVTSFLRLSQSGQKPIEAVSVTIRVRDAANELKVNEQQTVSVTRFVGTERPTEATSTPTPGQPVSPRILGLPTPTPQAQVDKFVNYALRTADISFAIPIESLTPGAYLLTIEATLGSTTIRRDVRFSVK
jgi:VWFA-related protein